MVSKAQEYMSVERRTLCELKEGLKKAYENLKGKSKRKLIEESIASNSQRSLESVGRTRETIIHRDFRGLVIKAS